MYRYGIEKALLDLGLYKTASAVVKYNPLFAALNGGRSKVSDPLPSSFWGALPPQLRLGLVTGVPTAGLATYLNSEEGDSLGVAAGKGLGAGLLVGGGAASLKHNRNAASRKLRSQFNDLSKIDPRDPYLETVDAAAGWRKPAYPSERYQQAMREVLKNEGDTLYKDPSALDPRFVSTVPLRDLADKVLYRTPQPTPASEEMVARMRKGVVRPKVAPGTQQLIDSLKDTFPGATTTELMSQLHPDKLRHVTMTPAQRKVVDDAYKAIGQEHKVSDPLQAAGIDLRDAVEELAEKMKQREQATFGGLSLTAMDADARRAWLGS